jgi:hypothetical protein
MAKKGSRNPARKWSPHLLPHRNAPTQGPSRRLPNVHMNSILREKVQTALNIELLVDEV